DAAINWIAQNGYDETFGARPLKRLLKTQVENNLAIKILDGEIADNDVAQIDVKDDKLEITKLDK
ncbi:MAG: chaperone protein ClpB, partial [Alphaproteobacteria bacterium]|nr:chaperone protein ClpB [Alphaproteobacteria bacterium]